MWHIRFTERDSCHMVDLTGRGGTAQRLVKAMCEKRGVPRAVRSTSGDRGGSPPQAGLTTRPFPSALQFCASPMYATAAQASKIRTARRAPKKDVVRVADVIGPRDSCPNELTRAASVQIAPAGTWWMCS